jgi:hypothetical protein
MAVKGPRRVVNVVRSMLMHTTFSLAAVTDAVRSTSSFNALSPKYLEQAR